MRSPLVTALVVTPLLGFNLASAVDLCASSSGAAGTPTTATATATATALAGAQDGGADCSREADRWTARAWTLPGPVPDAVAAGREAYRQGCSDARAALAAGR